MGLFGLAREVVMLPVHLTPPATGLAVDATRYAVGRLGRAVRSASAQMTRPPDVGRIDLAHHHRRYWSVPGRAHIELRAVEPARQAEYVQAAVSDLEELEGVTSTTPLPGTGRVVVHFEEQTTDVEAINDSLEDIESRIGVTDRPFGLGRLDHPSDSEAIDSALPAMATDVASLGIAGVGRMVRMPTMPVELDVATLRTVVSYVPWLRDVIAPTPIHEETRLARSDDCGSAPRQNAGAMTTDSTSPSAPPLLETVRVRGFRTLRDTSFSPGPLSALVGAPGAGKSNLLASIRSALDPEGAPLTHGDVARAATLPIHIAIETGGGARVRLKGEPPATTLTREGDLPPVLYMPARLRAGRIIDPGSEQSSRARTARDLVDTAIASQAEHRQSPSDPPGATEAAHGLVSATETWEEAGLTGVVVLVEEPELFLTPQTQRYLYRRLRRLAGMGNQVLYSTHSPSFLNVARLQELVLTEHDPAAGTRLVQPEPLAASDEFRAYSEFDATRSEMFLSRAAVLVEGQTERLALPFVFQALGHDPDREGISIVECGGKPNIPLIARVAMAAGIPFVAVHDRDAPEGEDPIQSEQVLNEMIGDIAGDNRVELAPDFEGVAGLRGHVHKPARAWRSFATLSADEVPPLLGRIVSRAVELARGRGT
jgi:hypothetical protein